MLWIAIRPARCPEFTRRELTRLALGMTSQCAWHERDTLLMDVSASLSLFGGVRNMRALLRTALSEILISDAPISDALIGDMSDGEAPADERSRDGGGCGGCGGCGGGGGGGGGCGGITASISISAMGAWVLAQSPVSGKAARGLRPSGACAQSWSYALTQRRLVQRTDRLPVSLLSVCTPYLRWLQGIGCVQIGQLRALPRAPLQARTSPQVLHVLDQIEARAIWPYQSCQMPEHFAQRRSLDEPVYHVSLLFTLLHPLLMQLCNWLQEHHWAVSAWEVRLFHAGRREHRAPSRLRIALAKPGWRIEHLAHLLEVRLQSWQLPAPVTDMMVLSDVVAPRQLQNQTLFADVQTQQQDLLHTLDTLRARLGDEAIRMVAAHADHRPEQANRWQCASSALAQRGRDAAASEVALTCTDRAHPHSPAWLLPQAQRLETRHEQPWLGQALRLLHGPYRIETGWWDHMPAQRDYFVACDKQARHYWIYCERKSDGASWYLHGLFG